nr:hypothetical protein [Oscillospiraceae bacterium]
STRGPAATAAVLERLAALTVTEDNWALLAALVDCLDIPQKQAIIARWREKFAPGRDREDVTPSAAADGANE